MNKSFLIITSITLLICFSAGIFVEILSMPENLSLALSSTSTTANLLAYIKSDLIITLFSFICAITVFLIPLIILSIMGKAFALGFSTAYIATTLTTKSLPLICLVLFPRGLIKIPTYIALLIISLSLGKYISNNRRKKKSFQEIKPYLKHYIICFLILTTSSLVEVFLLQAFL